MLLQRENEIPDTNGTSQSIHVGVYPVGEGVVTINEPPNYSFDHDQLLTCTSTGGPATTLHYSQILGGVSYRSYNYYIGDEYEIQSRRSPRMAR